ncbi:MAG: molybdenum ABC transporter ATP-binding protein [Marinobacter sp.]|uniref:molybdenum ABC transporter ATP-binding protein n=1 Tax=Marinobacter sp. TaxID=50741 RepID=UPI00299CFB98|nr:molybdenum ABC transporter ATP-binding protein [Marinobacter sp.]MDX1634399.1 molybdenum ABC transporter ATP-binding protein [Marinobacter sp.]
MSGATGIEIRLRKSLANFTLDLDLTLPGRGVSAVFGPSGCGKTTLLRCLAGLESADGRLVVNGEVWQAPGRFVPVHKRPLAYVFQETSLFPHLNVQRNLEYGYHRVPAHQRQVSPEQAIHWLGLKHLLARRPEGLSGGERQRVAIARALLTSPRLLLMDEPLSALDLASRQDILPYLGRLHDELAVPVIYVTHSPDELARIADHVLVMRDGRAVATGGLTEITARRDLHRRHSEEAGVILEATITECDPHWHLCRAEFAGGALWFRDTGAAPGSRVRLRIMARDVSLALGASEDQSIVNRLPATITDINDGGHPAVALVGLAVAQTPLLALVTRLSLHRLGLDTGDTCWLQIKSVAVLD